MNIKLSVFKQEEILRPSNAREIESKLEEQFILYDAAKRYIIQKVGREGRLISREDWESLLKPTNYLSDAELIELQRNHYEYCCINAQTARISSIIDLNKLRSNRKTLQKFCYELPKGGMLHIHPNGTVNRETAHSLLQQSNPNIDHDTIHNLVKDCIKPHEYDFLEDIISSTNYLELNSELQNKLLNLYVLPNGNAHSFDRFLGVFLIQYLYKNDTNSIAIAEHVIRNFLARARNHSVIYVEFNNHPIGDYPISRKTLEQLASHVEEWEEEYGITVRFNYSFHRTSDPEVTRQQARGLLDLDSPYITGIDLLGDETNAPALEKGQTIYATISAAKCDLVKKLGFTMHAGELGDQRNPRDAILLGASRIGHGVALMNDIVVLEYARRQQLGVEINLASNQRLGVHLDPKSHPFLHYLRLGLKPSLSTDDEGMFETDISREFFVAIMETDITYAEVKQLVVNSIDTAFVDPETKACLIERLITQFAVFEKEWVNL